MPSLLGGKWGRSRELGEPGGTVTWSIVSGRIEGVRDLFPEFARRGDQTVNPFQLYDFSVISELEAAFQAWSDVANIEFVRVQDDGAELGRGSSGDIRVAFGPIDGDGPDARAKGVAYSPPFSPISRPEQFRTGDILIDSLDGEFLGISENFRMLAMHEIGHAIGLGHVDITNAIMNPRPRQGPELFQDDIIGARQIYGRQDRAPKVLEVGEDAIIGDEFVKILSIENGLRILGSDQNDTVQGGGGNERIFGGAGNDRLSGGNGNDLVRGQFGNDTLKGQAGNDKLRGQAGDDLLVGGQNADNLNGGSGADRIRGGSGDDKVIGGGGNDILIGGSGEDQFIFSTNAGNDKVRGFSSDVDKIVFRQIIAFEDLKISSVNRSSEIDYGTGTITLIGVSPTDIKETDFIF